MIKPWIFEFTHAINRPVDEIQPEDITEEFDRNLAIWESLESFDYEGIFFSEHHFDHAYAPSPNLFIAALAQRTERIRLGVMGVVAPFYQPWRLYEEIAMLDHLSHGRLEIGCANGVPQELGRVGYDMEESRARFNEALDILDMALADQRVTYHGKYWNVDNLTLLPGLLQQPAPPKWTTIVSKGSAKKSAGRNSKVCTGFQTVELITEIFDVYREEAARLGADLGADDIGLRRHVLIDEDATAAEEASAAAKAHTANMLSADSRVSEKPKAEILDAPQAGSSFTVADEEYVSGTPSQVAEQIIEQCRACGAGHFLALLGRGSGADRQRMVNLFGEKVVPELRKAEVG